MFPIDNATASATLPASTAAGTPGYFTDGNAGTGLAPTVVPAEFLNMVMLELMNIVSGAGLTPDKTKQNQVLQAVQRLSQKNIVLADAGAANAYSAVNVPALVAADLVTGLVQRVTIAHTNTGASTYSPDGLAAKPIYGLGLVALQGGELTVSGVATFMYLVAPGVNGGNGAWIALNCAGSPLQVADGTQSHHAVSLSQAQGMIGASRLQSIGWSRAGNALTLTYAGGTLDFSNASLANGAPVAGVVVPALSIVIPSAASLGSVAGQSTRLAMFVEYNGGSPVLAVTNLGGGVQVDESNLHSPTTISAAATSAGVVYSTSAVAANSPYRFIGFVDVPGNNSGWVADVTNAKGAGGQALSALSSLGFGQKWQTASLLASTTYYNTTGRTIGISIVGSGSTSGANLGLFVGGTQIDANQTAGTEAISVAGLIPPGASYSYTNNAVSGVYILMLR